MNVRKKFLHCTMLCILSPVFIGSATSSALATRITNVSEVPQNIKLHVAGNVIEVGLMPYKSWQSNAYPVRVEYNGYLSPALEPRSQYAIWQDGKVVMQKNRRSDGRN